MRYNLACTMVRQLGNSEDALEALQPFFNRMNSATGSAISTSIPTSTRSATILRFKEMLAAAKERLGMPAAAQ